MKLNPSAPGLTMKMASTMTTLSRWSWRLNRLTLLLAILGLPPALYAQSGVWTDLTTGGLWSNPANWQSGVVADGSGNTADFSQANITANNTVHMDASHTLTSLLFKAGATANFTLDDNNSSGANILTLISNGISPTILVSGGSKFGPFPYISATITGTQSNMIYFGGQYSSSAGSPLILSGTNTFDAPITVTNSLQFTSITNVGGGSSALGAPTSVGNGTIYLVYPGWITYVGTANATSDRNIVTTFYQGQVGNNGPGLLTLNGSITANNHNLYLRGNSTLIVNGYVNNGTYVLTKTDPGTVVLTCPTNGFVGQVQIGGGTFSVSSITNGGIPCAMGATPAATGFTLGLATIFQFTGTNGGTTDRNITITGSSGGPAVIQNTVAGQTLNLTGTITTQPSGSVNSWLVFNGAGNTTVSGTIEDYGFASGSSILSLAQSGTGTLTISGMDECYGDLSVSNGTLAVSGPGSIATSPIINIVGSGKLDVTTASPAFALATGQTLVGNGGTGTVAGAVDLSAGSLTLNYSNGTPTLNVISGALHFGSNPVTVTVAGSTPLPGGSYELISTGAGGSLTGTLPSSVTVNGAGTVTNNPTLQITGGNLYLVVPASVATYPTNMAVTVKANQAVMSWPADHTGWHLQVQTNSLSGGIGANWVTIPGSDAYNTYTNTVNPTNGAVFYRMVYP